MNRRLTKKIYSHHISTLKEAEIKYRVTGRGKFMFVQFALDFSSATLSRYDNLDALIDAYSARLDGRDCHLEINLHFLSEANMLFGNEEEVVLTARTTRFSVCRSPSSDAWAYAA